MNVQERIDGRLQDVKRREARDHAEYNLAAAIIQWPEIQADAFNALPDAAIFANEQAAIVWAAALEVYHGGHAVDFGSLMQQIKESEGTVPVWYNTSIAQGTIYTDDSGAVIYPTRAAVPEWIRVLIEDEKFSVFQRDARRANSLEDARLAALKLLEFDRYIDGNDELPFDQSIEAFIERQRLISAGEIQAGHSWGIDAMDQQIILQPGCFYVVGALKKVGKSQLIQHTMLANALRTPPNPCFIFSLEMARDQLIRRWVANVSRMNSRTILTRAIQGEELAEITNAAHYLMDKPLKINDSPRITTAEIAARARTWKRKNSIPDGLGILAVDFVQLIPRAATKSGQSEADRIKEIAYDLARIAKELRVVVLAAAQLRNEAEGQKPHIRFLEGSGGIAQAAEGIIILDLPSRDKSDGATWKEIDAVIYQRNGESGVTAHLEADLSQCRFQERVYP